MLHSAASCRAIPLPIPDALILPLEAPATVTDIVGLALASTPLRPRSPSSQLHVHAARVSRVHATAPPLSPPLCRLLFPSPRSRSMSCQHRCTRCTALPPRVPASTVACPCRKRAPRGRCPCATVPPPPSFPWKPCCFLLLEATARKFAPKTTRHLTHPHPPPAAASAATEGGLATARAQPQRPTTTSASATKALIFILPQAGVAPPPPAIVVASPRPSLFAPWPPPPSTSHIGPTFHCPRRLLQSPRRLPLPLPHRQSTSVNSSSHLPCRLPSFVATLAAVVALTAVPPPSVGCLAVPALPPLGLP